jgi:lipopolysaccharide export system permease protein
MIPTSDDRMSTNSSGGAPQPAHRPLGFTFYRYVAREALRPTIFALVGLTVVILTNDLLGYSDLIINRGLEAGTVGAMALYETVPIAALMFPFSVLVGCLVAIGRLGADLEILTLEANGVPAGRLALPLIAFAAGMTVLSVWTSVVASPWANRSLDEVMSRIRSEKPWSAMQKGEVAEFGGWRVEAREVSSGGDELEGVLLWLPEMGETIFARSGRMEGTADGGVAIHLEEGSVLLSTNENARLIRFERMTTLLPNDEDDGKEREPGLAGLSLAELSERALRYVPEDRTSKPKAAIEYHRRIATPAATLVFGFLAAPLLLSRRGFSRSSGSVLGIVLTLGYYALNQLGEGLIQGNTVPPVVGVWMPNVLLLLLAIVLLLRVVRTRALGQAFDRPQRGRRATRKVDAEIGVRSSRYPLPRYITGRFLQMLLIAFGVMMVAYLLINVMERLDWFARYGASGDEILRYYAARLPLLASRVFPLSMLVAMALTVSVLAAEGELIGMRACGIPAVRALAPALVISAVMVPLFFALTDVVVPRTNALADDVKENEIKREKTEAEHREQTESVWYREGDRVLDAERFDPELGEARKLVIYDMTDDGHPIRRIDAEAAIHIGAGQWRLRNPRMIEVDGDSVRPVQAQAYAALGEVLPAAVSTSQLSVAALGRQIAEMEADGYDATAYEVDRWVKLAQPFACLILPALVLFFAVGGPPFPSPARNLLVSVVVGVGYLMATGVSASFGYGGTISPALGGWAPNLLFAMIASYLGLRLWRQL